MVPQRARNIQISLLDICENQKVTLLLSDQTFNSWRPEKSMIFAAIIGCLWCLSNKALTIINCYNKTIIIHNISKSSGEIFTIWVAVISRNVVRYLTQFDLKVHQVCFFVLFYCFGNLYFVHFTLWTAWQSQDSLVFVLSLPMCLSVLYWWIIVNVDKCINLFFVLVFCLLPEVWARCDFSHIHVYFCLESLNLGVLFLSVYWLVDKSLSFYLLEYSYFVGLNNTCSPFPYSLPHLFVV